MAIAQPLAATYDTRQTRARQPTNAPALAVTVAAGRHYYFAVKVIVRSQWASTDERSLPPPHIHATRVAPHFSVCHSWPRLGYPVGPQEFALRNAPNRRRWGDNRTIVPRAAVGQRIRETEHASRPNREHQESHHVTSSEGCTLLPEATNHGR